jgi:hypothetical protein
MLSRENADFKGQNMFIKFFKLGRSVTVSYKMFKLAFGERALRRTGIICFFHCALQKGKGKVTLEQATKVQRGSRGIALLFP